MTLLMENTMREFERMRMSKWAKDNGIECDNFVLKDRNKNFYPDIATDVVDYFSKNNIAWWTCKRIQDIDSKKPTRHLLSSQIACLNHLYPLRHDKDAVLAIAQRVHPEIVDVMKIETDRFFPAFISFEVVSDSDHLKERNSTRGSKCTSVDALIYGKRQDGRNIIVPIEWKYTEKYHEAGEPDKDYSIEDRGNQKEGKGKERLRRYSSLISNSNQLKSMYPYKNSVYFFDPFYQLMRQTLWAEQMCNHKDTETIKTDDFVHAHIVPNENTELLQYQYQVSKKEMEETWRGCLQNQEKYKIISPEDLLSNIDKQEHRDLINYLSLRYWNK